MKERRLRRRRLRWLRLRQRGRQPPRLPRRRQWRWRLIESFYVRSSVMEIVTESCLCVADKKQKKKTIGEVTPGS
jgi:hypothetical protein